MNIHPQPVTRPSIRAVAFDLDGLIFNTEDLYEVVGVELLRRRDKEMSAELLAQMLGRRARTALQMMIEAHDLTDSVKQLERETDEIFLGLLDDHLKTMPGVVELMGALEQARIPKSIATSSRREYVENILGRFKFIERFDFILSAEDVSRGKPDPEIYQVSAKRHQVACCDLMVLEDSPNGCQAGVKAGCFTVAVSTRHSQNQVFPTMNLRLESLIDRRLYDVLGLAPD